MAAGPAREAAGALAVKVDLCLGFVRHKSGTPIARFGGAWDTTRNEWAGDAERMRVIEVHGAQCEAISLLDRWLENHRRGAREAMGDQLRQQIIDMIEGRLELDASNAHLLGLSEVYLTGGRRSGKTLIMESILTSVAIAVEGSIVWTVTPAEPKHTEPVEVLMELMPTDWYQYNGWPHFTFYMVNGSKHRMISGHNPGNLKQGKALAVGLNEAQQIKRDSYMTARGATVDGGGFSIVAANPPIGGDVGTWVLDSVIECEDDRRFGAQHFFVDPLQNPHVDIAKFMALKSSMTAHDWETQVRGRMLQLPDRVLYEWSQSENERPPPQLGRCTREFLTAHEGDRAKWEHLVVIDVQSYPFVAVLVFDVFRDPTDPHNPRAGILWGIAEVALLQGDEVDACEALIAMGIDPKRTLVVMDASCAWQQAQREKVNQRPQFIGKGSMDIVRRCGFPHVVPPDRRMRANPDIFDRIRCTNALVRASNGHRALFVDPAKCPNAVVSARKWTLKRPKSGGGQGKPDRRGDAAHFGDVLGYAGWRFFPRRGTASKLLEEALSRSSAG